MLPKNSIITPHPKEFERLFGKTDNSLERIEKAQQKAQELGIVIVLKGAFTAVCSPDGNVYFNSTGNPGMATGGMGDVLTGVIAGLLSQHYSPLESALLGVFIHGFSADLALENQSEESLLPSDVIQYLGKSFKILHQK
ncbi:MAG: NAD(P)H-hydrate dehydratase [Paludibacteraceae bacterium]